MMSRTFLWAVSILCVLPEKGETPMRQSEVSERVRASTRYLEPLLQHFSSEGIVIGTRGPRGGSNLAKSPAEISLDAVAESVDRFRSPHRAGTREIDPPPVLKAVFNAWRGDLATLSVADLRVEA